MLRGIDPHRHLTTTDVLEVAVTRAALERSHEFREIELDHLAVRVVERLAEATGST